MQRYFLKFWNTEEIPHEAKILTNITSLRWLGWGFAESLIPVFLYTFGHTFAQAGLLRSSYDIAYIAALPIAGVLADRMRATSLVLIGLIFYLFVGGSYLLAGVTGLAIFIVVARTTNGVAYAFDSIGRNTCLRRHTQPSKLATVFGYLDTVADFWWIVGAALGIYLIKYFSIPSLLFLITPTSLIAIFILLKYRKKKIEKTGEAKREKVSFSSVFREVKYWNIKLKSLLVFNFFIYLTIAVIIFFLPIQAFLNGDGYLSIIMMGIVPNVPFVFSWKLGKLFDKRGKKFFTQSLFLFAFLVFSLAFTNNYFWQLIVMFSVSLIAELIYLGTSEMITVNSQPEHLGRVDGIMRSFGDLGNMIGPLAIGVIMDSYGFSIAYSVLGVIILTVAWIFYITNKK